ncbi:MAG: glycosyltransferase [Deltaproteobacteria bacterium]|nr:glycosyltransferase [Deltaproteobacteria bacterium]
MRGEFTVLHSESSLGWGGQENRTLHECLGLKRLGARPIIVCKPDSRLREKAASNGLDVRTHRMRSNRDISALLFCLQLIKQERVDVVSTHSGDDSLLLAVAGRLSSSRPIIVRTRHLALPITSKMSYSLLPHIVVTVSDAVRRYLVDEKGINANRVVSIPTGVDLKIFDPDSAPGTLRQELGLDSEIPIVGTVAILRKKKGHHVLLEAIPMALESFPSAVFVFAGDGPQRSNIEERIKSLGLGKSVKLLGLRKDVPAVLSSIDLFVLPTLQEALGTSILEAAAMKKAVIASNVGGVGEAVIDGVTGLLVPPEDAASLAGAIINLLKDREKTAQMGEAGRAMVERSFSMDAMARGMFELYNGLLEARRKRV